MNTTQTAIDLSPILSDIIMFVGVLLAGVATWAVTKVAAHYNIKLDDSARALIDTAITNGIKYAENQGQLLIAGAKVETGNAALATAVNYVIAHIPDALTRLGVTQQQLEEKIIARLPA